MVEKILWFILFLAAILAAAVFFVQGDMLGSGVLVLFSLAFLNARAQSPFLKLR